MDYLAKILLFTILFFSSVYSNASEGNKEFIETVGCAYDGSRSEYCKKIKPLDKFNHCPKEEFIEQGAISFGINHWSILQPSNIEIQTIKNVALSLLKKGCDINKLDIRGISALHNSILLSNHSAIVFLLENGADPYKKIGISRTEKYKGRNTGLNSFDLIKKQHMKDSVINNVVYADTKIYNYVQKKYPNELEPLAIKEVEVDLSGHTLTKFGKVLIKKTALDPKVLMFDIYANSQFPIDNQESKALHFQWFESQKTIQEYCGNYKIIDNMNEKVQGIDVIRYFVSCK